MSDYSSQQFYSDERMAVYIDRSREAHRRTEYRVRVLIDGKFDRQSGPQTKDRAHMLARQWIYGTGSKPTVSRQASNAGRILRAQRQPRTHECPLFEVNQHG